MISETEERELLRALKKKEGIEHCLLEGSAGSLFYHFSNIRENLLEWYEFRPEASLLEIGAECGALTGLFCRKVARVVAVEASERDCRVNRERNRQHGNLTVVTGDFRDLRIEEKFDYVTLIGGLGAAGRFSESDNPYLDMLSRAGNYLKPGGKLFLAIENKYGVKYFAGAPEDHTGRCFDGLENYAAAGDVRTFSRRTLEKMLVEAGFSHNEFYYPMPEYQFPSEIYSDRCLPSFGTLRYPCVSYDRDRYELLDERLVFDSVCEDGMFGDFANSFLVISEIGGDADDADRRSAGRAVIYAKYNRERAPEFQLSTKILVGEDGCRFVEKTALRPEAEAHVGRLSENREKLVSGAAPSGAAGESACAPLPVGIVHSEKGRVVFPYIEGRSLAREVHTALTGREGFLCAMHRALDSIAGTFFRSPDVLADFEVTGEFERIFGTYEGEEYTALFQDMKSFRVSNIDSILSNFVRLPDGGLVCLDYEWVFDFPVPVEYLLFRTVYYYYCENVHYIKMSEPELWADFGWPEQKIRLFHQMDDHFQQYVHGRDRRYMYALRYAKKTITIGKNFQRGEKWFVSIVNDIQSLNGMISDDIRDLVECHVETRRIDAPPDAESGKLAKLCRKVARKGKTILRRITRI